MGPIIGGPRTMLGPTLDVALTSSWRLHARPPQSGESGVNEGATSGRFILSLRQAEAQLFGLKRNDQACWGGLGPSASGRSTQLSWLTTPCYWLCDREAEELI